MRCVQLRDNSTLSYTFTQSTLSTPNPGQLRVRVKSCTVSYWDTSLVNGNFGSHFHPCLGIPAAAPPSKSSGKAAKTEDSKRARILGFEVAGVVDAVGASVMRFRQGDGVCAMLPLSNMEGGNAEYCVLDEEIVIPKPLSLTYDICAASLLPSLRAYHCLHYIPLPVKRAMTVVVDYGAHALQSVLLQHLLHALDGKAIVGVVVYSQEDENLVKLLPFGDRIQCIQCPLCHGENKSEVRSKWLSALRAFSQGLGVDIYIDAPEDLYLSVYPHKSRLQNRIHHFLEASSSGSTPETATPSGSRRDSPMSSGSMNVDAMITEVLQDLDRDDEDVVDVEVNGTDEKDTEPKVSNDEAEDSEGAAVSPSILRCSDWISPNWRTVKWLGIMDVLSDHGHVVLSGPWTSSHVPLEPYVYGLRGISVHNVWEPLRLENGRDLGRYVHAMTDALQKINDGSVHVAVSNRFRLEQTREAHRQSLAENYGRVLLCP